MSNGHKLPFTINQDGFVIKNGIKLPFKYYSESNEIEFVIKHPNDIRRNKNSRFIRIQIAQLFILPLLYSPNSEFVQNLECPECNKKGVSEFNGIIDSDIILKCLHCDHENTAQIMGDIKDGHLRTNK